MNYLECRTIKARFGNINWYTIQIEWLELTFAFWEISISDNFSHICHFPSSELTSRQPIPYYSLSLEKALRVMMPYDNKRAQQLLWICFIPRGNCDSQPPLNQVLSRRATLFELVGVSHYKRKIRKIQLIYYSDRMARLNICVLRNFDFRQFFQTCVIFRRASQLAASRSRITLWAWIKLYELAHQLLSIVCRSS